MTAIVSTSKNVTSNNITTLSDSSLDFVDKIYLEDFGLSDLLVLPSEVENLRLSVSFVHDNSDLSLYSKAVNRLMEITPNLRSVELEGGYIYRPAVETREVLALELGRFRDHLEHLSAIFATKEVPIKSMRFSGIYTFEEKTIEKAKAASLLKTIFGFSSNQLDVQRDVLDFNYSTAHEHNFAVRLLIGVHFLKEMVPIDRSRFYDNPNSLNRLFAF
ncbi:hypothetical protein M3Y96_01045700 [Aphelenchoides besseyi]|nr:hypothetical protein M3Y96_01045700 [Aphelenchoides besseyi]